MATNFQFQHNELINFIIVKIVRQLIMMEIYCKNVPTLLPSPKVQMCAGKLNQLMEHIVNYRRSISICMKIDWSIVKSLKMNNFELWKFQ